MAAVAFWGLVIKPGKSYTQKVESPFKVTMAAFGEKIESHLRTTVILKSDGNEFAICSLTPKFVEQQPLDLVFSGEDEISFYTSGCSTIHLTGYYISDDLHDESCDQLSMLDLDSEEEEESPKIVELSEEEATGKRPKNETKSQGRKKRKFEAQVNEEDEDELGESCCSHDDDDDEDDEDEDEDDEMDDFIDNEEEDEEQELPTKNRSIVDHAKTSKRNETATKNPDMPYTKTVVNSPANGQQKPSEKVESTTKSSANLSVKTSSSPLNEKIKASSKEQAKMPSNGLTPAKQADKTPVKNAVHPVNKTPKGTAAKDQATKTPIKSETDSTTAPPKPQSANKTPTFAPKDQSINRTPSIAPVKSTPTKEQKSVSVKDENIKKTPQKPAEGSSEKKRTLANGLTLEDVKDGSGKKAKIGRRVSVRYIGRLENGKEFDSNKSGKPFTFTLGKGEVIKGWDFGIEGMSVGGQRKLVIPAKLAYGAQGAPPSIPKNATLHFEVELITID